MSAPLAVVFTTVDDEGRARELAALLVEERLAACIQIETIPVQSVYRWDEGVEWASEWRLMLKLPASQVERMRRRLFELHPYDTPEFVVVDAEASSAYARWVTDSCS